MDNKTGAFHPVQQQQSVQPPSYNSVINNFVVPQPSLPVTHEQQRVQSNININYGLLAIGAPLSTYGDITEVVYGEQEEQRRNQCCCCDEGAYLFIPDNYSLSIRDHSVIGVICPKCQTGVIKLAYIKESCSEGNRVSVCLNCKTVYPLR